MIPGEFHPNFCYPAPIGTKRITINLKLLSAVGELMGETRPR